MAAKKIKDRIKELRAMDDVALTALTGDALKAIYEIRRSRLSVPEVNVKATKSHKKEIARVLTIKRQREIAAQKAQ